MPKTIIIILFLILLFMTACESAYNDCTQECRRIINCTVEGAFCIPPPCPEVCNLTQTEYCFNLCR